MLSKPFNRRQFLNQSAKVLTAGMLFGASPTLGSVNAAPQSSKRYKLGVCDWFLGKRADPASFGVAKQIGFDGVQVDMGTGTEQLPMFNPELQQQIKAAAQKHSLEIASLAMGVLNDIPLKSDPRAEQWVAESIGIAKALGVKVILLAFFSNGDLNNDPKGVDSVVNKLINLAPAAEQAGVLLALESWLSAAESMKILERVGSPAVKVYYDVGNSQHMGYDIYKEIRTLGKERICEFHAKDYDDLYGKGSIRFDEVRKAMDEIGYEGWIQVEGIKTPLGLEQSLLADLEYLRGIFG